MMLGCLAKKLRKPHTLSEVFSEERLAFQDRVRCYGETSWCSHICWIEVSSLDGKADVDCQTELWNHGRLFYSYCNTISTSCRERLFLWNHVKKGHDAHKVEKDTRVPSQFASWSRCGKTTKWPETLKSCIWLRAQCPLTMAEYRNHGNSGHPKQGFCTGGYASWEMDQLRSAFSGEASEREILSQKRVVEYEVRQIARAKESPNRFWYGMGMEQIL